jgi:DNA polymerase-3 subunit delta
MVALKSNEVDAFLAHPNPARPIVLIYGPDAGLVRERAQAIINASVDDPNDPFALAHLAGDELASEPSRLAEEAHTVPLFGGKRASCGGPHRCAHCAKRRSPPPSSPATSTASVSWSG